MTPISLSKRSESATQTFRDGMSVRCGENDSSSRLFREAFNVVESKTILFFFFKILKRDFKQSVEHI